MSKRTDKDDSFSHISHPKKRAFLAAYSQCAYIREACKLVNISRQTHYSWLDSDPEYEQAFKLAKDDYVDSLEREADRRGAEGYDEPVYLRGIQVGTKKRYSDQLLMFRLKALRPEEYRERSETINKEEGEGGLANFRVAGMSQEEARQQLIEEYKKEIEKLSRPLRA